MTQPVRIEHDLIGDRQVPAAAYYGVHTLRALENFPITGTAISIYPDLIQALADAHFTVAGFAGASGAVAAGPASNTQSVACITRRATSTGLRTCWMQATPPAARESPAITLASISTSPAAFSTEPVPALK